MSLDLARGPDFPAHDKRDPWGRGCSVMLSRLICHAQLNGKATEKCKRKLSSLINAFEYYQKQEPNNVI